MHAGMLGTALVLMTLTTPASATGDPPRSATGDSPASVASPSERLAALFAEHERWTNLSFPEDALRRGARTNAATLTDLRPGAIAARAEETRRFLRNLHEIDRTALAPEERLNADLFEYFLLQSIESFERGAWLFAVGPIHGPHQRIPQMAERVPFRSMQDFRDYAARLRAAPAQLDATIETLRLGIERGMTPPRVVIEGVPAQCAAIRRGRLSTLLEPLLRLPADAAPAEAAAITDETHAAVVALLAAIERYERFLREYYLPQCRESIGAFELPDGRPYYDWCLRLHTTTDLDADQIHEIGVAEVIRLRDEMLQVIRRTDWYAASPARGALEPEALFDQFVAYLRADPRFRHETPEALIAGYREICKRVDGLLPGLFRTLPRLPYGVREIPRFMAPTQTTAYYQPGSLEGGVAGFFMANTYALDQRPTYEMIPLALHEAVPGHHLQIALAQELPNLPLFRRESGVSAFVEGWALYAERLGIEMGLYDSPYDDFGRLLYEMWRSCRLVVDTGMHARGWTREEAIEFMRRNTALSELNIEREIDRYIAWPGQACAYKIGELKIRGLRAAAEARLGSAFDLREFHEVVLGAGAVPLAVLGARVMEWIDRCAAAAGR